MKSIAAGFSVWFTILLTSISANAGSIAGTVTGSDGSTVLADIQVQAYVSTWWAELEVWDWNYIGSTTTGVDGQYVLADLAAGTYRVVFQNGDGSVSEIYDNVSGSVPWEGGSDLILAEDTVLDAINAQLDMMPMGSISGTVTGPDGTTALEGMRVDANSWNNEYEWWDWINYDYTDTDGAYEISGLAPGTYRVQFQGSGYYQGQVYSGADNLDEGQDIVVVGSETVGTIDASLAAAGAISGTVYGPDGTTGLSDVYVIIYRHDGAGWIQTGYDYTDENGLYEIGGVATGMCRVVFNDWNYGYMSETYNDVPGTEPANGTDVSVVAGETTTGINATLSEGAKITGTVTGSDGTTTLEGIQVVAYAWNDEGWWDWIDSDYTDTDGVYEIIGLAPGTYRVEFRGSGYYQRQVYSGAVNLYLGQDVVIVGTETVGSIDASLAAAGAISGTVYGPDGTTGLSDVYVIIYRHDGAGWIQTDYDYTDENGLYEIGGVATGMCRVVFNDWNYGYMSETYNDVPGTEPANGTDVSVVAGETTTGVDALLSEGAKITGTVIGADGTLPLEGIQVVAYTWNSEYSYWEWNTSANTDTDGSYEISGLAPGTYRVQFQGSGYYQGQVYSGADNLDEGQDIVVVGSETVGNIDASLTAGGAIGGTVTRSDGTTGLQNIYVQLSQWNEWCWDSAGSSWTDENGQYEIGGIAAGTYRVVFYDWNNGCLSETYDDIPGTDPGRGANVVVVVGETTGGIDASLALESRISGTVTGPGAETVANVAVEAYRWDGGRWSWEGWARTDADGQYDIGGLSAGTYRLDFSPVGNYVPASLDSVTLAAELELGNNNITLQVYARLSGMVYLADGVTPVSGVRVYMRNDAGDMVWRQSGADGSYAFSGLRPGNYSVVAAPSTGLGLLGKWYDDGGLYVPGQDTPPPEAAVIALDYGDVQTGIDFDLDPAGRISGTVTAEGGAPLAGAYVKAKNSTHGLTRMAQTDDTGVYELMGLLPGDQKIKAGAEDYRDEWWTDAAHEDQAAPIAVVSGSDLTNDFVLLPGQNPALVEIVSDPSGAAIYLDYQATSFVTPALVDVGEVASHAPRMGGWAVASHVVTLKKDGHPRPAPQVLPAVEAETVSITIDMTSAAEGGLIVVTDPADAEVYIDYADVADGVTPLTIGSLAPGSHTVLLKKSGYLQARPIIAQVEAGATNEIVVPLAPIFSPDRIMAEVQSSPTGATIYVDYFPTADITDAVIDWMDPASHSGSGWHSASHTVMLHKLQKLPGAPRYVPDVTNAVQTNLVHMIVDVTATADEDGDDMPDSWEPDEDDYPGWGGQGPDDDYDGDGVSNFGELIAGTHPGERDSVFEIDEGDLSSPGNNDSFTLTFSSVPGRMYFIRGKTSMSRNAKWVNLTGIIVATGFETTCTVQFPEGENMRFFQLVVWNP